MKLVRLGLFLASAGIAVFLITNSFQTTTNASSVQKKVTIIMTGTLVAGEGIECDVVLLNNYQLVGNLQGFGPGDTVTVTGATGIETYCQEGTALRVISIRSAQ